MRSRRADREQVAEVARRRLELLSAELAGITRSLDEDERPFSAPDGRRGAVPQEPGGGPQPHLARSEDRAQPMPGRHAHRPVGLSARCTGWLRDRLPPTLHGAVSLSSAHLTVVALLVAGALALTTWWVLRAEADPVVMAPTAAARSPAVRLPTTPSPVPETAASSAAGADAMVVVDVAGKVRRPGIATLPAGSRVVDAIEAAGGVRRNVDLTTVNLARILVDGEQILVGLPPPRGVAAPAASAPVRSTGPVTLVNLNTATQADLEELPGVGPVTAEAILQWRTEHGSFTAVDELLEVSGIGEATLAEIAPFVTL